MARGSFVLVLLLAATTAWARPEPLAVVGRISVEAGVINDAFALDDSGRTLAWVETTGGGTVLHLGPATGGANATVDLTDFTVTPERIQFVAGQWFVIANEGEGRAAAVVSGRKLGARIGPFGDALVSRGKTFVTMTQRGSEAAGRSFTIAAYRPGGGLLAQKQLAVGPEGEIVGSRGLGFIGFVNGYLQALVRKPGTYDPRTDARGPSQVAIYDVLAERVGPGKVPSDIPRTLAFAAKRNERPGVELFVRGDDGGQGLELVGPGEKLRPLVLPLKLTLFDHAAIAQQVVGNRLIFSLTRDPLNDDQVAAGKKGERSLAFFAVEAGSAKVTSLGEIPLGETQEYAWAAGGNRIAVLLETQPNAGTTLLVYQSQGIR